MIFVKKGTLSHFVFLLFQRFMDEFLVSVKVKLWTPSLILKSQGVYASAKHMGSPILFDLPIKQCSLLSIMLSFNSTEMELGMARNGSETDCAADSVQSASSILRGRFEPFQYL